jgi:hypothetical protein
MEGIKLIVQNEHFEDIKHFLNLLTKINLEGREINMNLLLYLGP